MQMRSRCVGGGRSSVSRAARPPKPLRTPTANGPCSAPAAPHTRAPFGPEDAPASKSDWINTASLLLLLPHTAVAASSAPTTGCHRMFPEKTKTFPETQFPENPTCVFGNTTYSGTVGTFFGNCWEQYPIVCTGTRCQVEMRRWQPLTAVSAAGAAQRKRKRQSRESRRVSE